MRRGIKIKFSIFLASVLLLTVFLLSVLVLNGIKNNQRLRYEEYLEQQADIANTYFIQTILAQPSESTETYLAENGINFAEKLELISGQTVALYDKEGNLVRQELPESEKMKKTLNYSLDDKISYLTEGNDLYYFAPIKLGNEQVGVIRFNYSLNQYQEFYQQIKRLFIIVGSGVFLGSFILAYFYFGSFANSIIRLEKAVSHIGEGHYDVPMLMRKDELGSLSEGIHDMSLQIKSTLENMEAEHEKLTLAVGRLSQLDQQQKQFIGNVTHEFKTPLTSIKANLDLLEMYPGDNELVETASNRIKNDTDKLYEMVVKVLDLSALDKYEFEYQMEPLEIKQIIINVLSSLSGKLDKFGIQAKSRLVEANVKGDRDSLMIVLMNLLDNAIKYNKTNGSILVTNEVQDNYMIIDIADTGIGMPEEFANKIFEPFYTIDKNRAREKGGVGLGLSLAQNILRDKVVLLFY